MKRLLLIPFLLILSFTLCKAQVIVDGSPTSQKSPNALDSIVYRITYKSLSVEDTTKKDKKCKYQYKEDLMRLDIGHHLNRFYSYTREQYDSLLRAGVSAGGVLSAPKVPSGGITWILYQNYPEGKTTFVHRWNSMRLKVTEDIEQPAWTIVSDSTATILGYHCTMATATFKGRKWTVWYTEDIPMNVGPWKLNGLPGLVLKAEDSERQYLFSAVVLQQIHDIQPIPAIKSEGKYRSIDMKTYRKIIRETSIGEALAASGIRIGVGTDPEWNKQFKSYISKTQPSNPIEKE